MSSIGDREPRRVLAVMPQVYGYVCRVSDEERKYLMVLLSLLPYCVYQAPMRIMNLIDSAAHSIGMRMKYLFLALICTTYGISNLDDSRTRAVRRLVSGLGLLVTYT